MKTWQKLAVTLVAAIACLGVIGVLAIISILPNPTDIGRKLSAKTESVRSVKTQIREIAKATESAAHATSEPLATAAASSLPASPSPSIDSLQSDRRRAISEKFIERYLSSDRIESHVCDNLDSMTTPFATTEEFGAQLESSLMGEARPSAMAEAVMLPIEYTLKNEAVRELVASAKNAADRGNTGFFQKAQFYAQAMRATASIMESRGELENVSAQAYQLYALSRASTLKPEILQDPELSDLCRGLERAAVDGLARDSAYDRERMARLLERHGIENEAIGYDPNLSTGVRIVTDDGGFQIKMPWLEKALKPSTR